MLKTVGASGQLSLGKKLAGRHFELEVLPDGSILLAPLTVSRVHPRKATPAKGTKAARLQFHVFKVDQFVMPSREEIHQRGPVR